MLRFLDGLSFLGGQVRGTVVKTGVDEDADMIRAALQGLAGMTVHQDAGALSRQGLAGGDLRGHEVGGRTHFQGRLVVGQQVIGGPDAAPVIAMELRSMLPEAVIEYAHGKMPERQLEDVMHRFINKEIDVLVSTTIIETGLDIPNVNTIIIHNADNFGLSQLYQLRGRVGRSDRSAYAFLLYRRDKMIKEVAEKRLSAIREFTELGSGYKISMKDLEIRGAGNILGSSQSGHLEEVGYDLYVKMLNEAIRTRLGEKDKYTDFDTSIDLSVDAYIPDEYVRNEYLKLELYKRIARIENQADADLIIDEAKDRFGEPPKVFLRLIRIAVLKASAHETWMSDIKYQDGFVQYLFAPGADILVDKIPKFMKKYKNNIRVVTAKKSGFAIRTSKLIQDDMLTAIEAAIQDIRDNLFETTTA